MIQNDILYHLPIGIFRRRAILRPLTTGEEDVAQSIVIIGAGLCGGRAALSLRDRGFGGQVTLIGSEPHPPYDRPPLSKSFRAEPELRMIAEPDAFAAHGINHVSGRDAVAIDRSKRKVILGDGTDVAYDRLLLATGARPRALPGVAPAPDLLTLRTHADAVAIQKRLGAGRRLVVIGGGFIGLELAAAARQCGATVTVIEGLPRLLARAVPAEIAEVVELRHRKEGVEILLNARITSIAQGDNGMTVQLADGTSHSSDLVVAGIGAVPNVELAEQAGLAIDNGIAVDACLMTSDPDIFAAGDCCSFPAALYDDARLRLESWRCAQDQGVLAAGNLLGENRPFVDAPWFWSDQYDLTLQIAGYAASTVNTVRRDLADDAFLLFHLDGQGRLIAASGIGTGNAVARDIRLAEMLINMRAHPSADALSSPGIRLKSLIAA
jgi:3-phenylpropionate/trans-cinnamate dioxygenase ferredoxin reductase subunit